MDVLTTTWATDLTRDFASAKVSIFSSSLSLLVPRTNTRTPFWFLWQEYIAAAARGIRVDLLLPAPTQAHRATLQNIANGQLAVDKGIHVHYKHGPSLHHAKAHVIDSVILWIGSGNLTAAAANHNSEIYSRALVPGHARDVERHFRSLANVQPLQL